MAVFETIDRGSTANDGTGDPPREWARKTNDNFTKAANITEDNVYTGKNTFNNFLSFGTAVENTISSGVLTITRSHVLVNGEGGLADDLTNITPSVEGCVLILKRASSSGTISVLETGNIRLGAASRALTETKDKLMLIYDNPAGVWCELSYVDN